MTLIDGWRGPAAQLKPVLAARYRAESALEGSHMKNTHTDSGQVLARESSLDLGSRMHAHTTQSLGLGPWGALKQLGTWLTFKGLFCSLLFCPLAGSCDIARIFSQWKPTGTRRRREHGRVQLLWGPHHGAPHAGLFPGLPTSTMKSDDNAAQKLSGQGILLLTVRQSLRSLTGEVPG